MIRFDPRSFLGLLTNPVDIQVMIMVVDNTFTNFGVVSDSDTLIPYGLLHMVGESVDRSGTMIVTVYHGTLGRVGLLCFLDVMIRLGLLLYP